MKTTTRTNEPSQVQGGLTQIARACRRHEAHLAAALLHSANIRADVLDPSSHNQLPHAGLALGWMRLMVPPAQRDEALRLLATIPTSQVRLGWRKLLIFVILTLYCSVPPMMGGPYLRGPEETLATPA